MRAQRVGRTAAVVALAMISTTLGVAGGWSPGIAGAEGGQEDVSLPVWYDAEAETGSVYRLYRAYFDRHPARSETKYWTDTLASGVSLETVSDTFTKTDEFRARYGNVDNPTFVDLVYENVLGRVPDQEGRDFWLRSMQAGMSRGAVMLHFSDSAEYRSITRRGFPSYVDVAGLEVSCDRQFQYYGVEGCIDELLGLEFKYVPPPSGTPATRLAVYFHGSRDDSWVENWGLDPGLRWQAEREPGVIVAAFRGRPYERDGEQRCCRHGDLEHDNTAYEWIIDAIADKYGASTDHTLFWGASHGANFLTSGLLTDVGHRLPGDYAILCGGFAVGFMHWDPLTDTAARDRIRLAFIYGDQDFLADEARYSRDTYANTYGFSVSETVYPGADHCNHPFYEPISEFWTGG